MGKMLSSNVILRDLAMKMAHCFISIDLFVLSTGLECFRNLQTMADLAKFSSGNLFYYPNYEYYKLGLRFTNELYSCLTRECAWEAVFRLRTSPGFNQSATLGNKVIK